MSARDLRYGRRGGRWLDGTAAEALAAFDAWRAQQAEEAAAAELGRNADEQLAMFDDA